MNAAELSTIIRQRVQDGTYSYRIPAARELAHGWSVSEMGRQLHKAARNANDNTVTSVAVIASYVRRWERDKIAPAERYRLYYRSVLGIPPEQFGRYATLSPREFASSSMDAMRRELGVQLAALRREAGLTQEGLSRLICFSRSTIASAEVAVEGQRLGPEFWQACDKAPKTRGVLASGRGADQAGRQGRRTRGGPRCARSAGSPRDGGIRSSP